MIYDVICPECGFVYHETTPKYDPGKNPNPTMCRLKDPYKSWGWDDFINDPGAGVGDMNCPGCDALYAAPGGKLIVRPQQGESDSADKQWEGEFCPKCGKPESDFKSKSGFVNHKRLCRGS